jgi:2-dehydropantoate 2-reductase
MQANDLTRPPITVIGAGAIGGTVGAYLADAGFDVTLVDTVREHVDAINEDGLRLTGDRGENIFRIRAVHSNDVTGPLGVTFLCVKGHFTDAAMAQYGPLLADDGYIVSLQNGLNEEIIAQHVGRERTVGAFVHFGADYLEPGLVLVGQEGPLFVGELDGSITERIESVRDILNYVIPTTITTNINGYLWGKLCYGATIFAVSTVDAPVVDVIDDELGRQICRMASAEGYLVGMTQAQPLEMIGDFNPNDFAPGDDFVERADASLLAMAVPWRTSVKQHMGPWRDLAIKRRKTEIDMQIKVIVDFGQRLGIPTPVNAAVLKIIHEIEEGHRGMEWSNLEEIAAMAGMR